MKFTRGGCLKIPQPVLTYPCQFFWKIQFLFGLFCASCWVKYSIAIWLGSEMYLKLTPCVQRPVQRQSAQSYHCVDFFSAFVSSLNTFLANSKQ